jgi:hypothetical protein
VRKIEELGWAGIAAVSVSALGLGLGLLWYLVVPPLPVRKVEGGFAYIQPDPEQPVAADGWFAILGLLFGVLMALAFWAILRKSRGPVQLAGLVLGAIAAGWIAFNFGMALEKQKYDAGMKAAVMEQIVDSPAKINAVKRFNVPLLGNKPLVGTPLVPALGVSLAYAVLAGWSRWPSLRPHEQYDDDDINLLMAGDLTDQATPGPPSPPAEGLSPAPESSARREDGWPDPPR